MEQCLIRYHSSYGYLPYFLLSFCLPILFSLFLLHLHHLFIFIVVSYLGYIFMIMQMINMARIVAKLHLNILVKSKRSVFFPL